MFLNCSTCFGRHTAHHQELKNCNCSLWFYIRLWLPSAAMPSQRLQLQFLNFWWWAVCRPKHVEQLRNIGIINSTTRSHFVGSVYEIYVTMHGSMNIKHRLYARCKSKDQTSSFFEWAEEFKYLGIILTNQYSIQEEIKNRLIQGMLAIIRYRIFCLRFCYPKI
jgi:hypothetical protein